MNIVTSFSRALLPGAVLTTVLASGAFCSEAGAVEFFVSPNGSDSDPGSQEKPFATLTRAQGAARTAKAAGPVTVHLRSGTYYLADTLVLTAEDSGTAQAPVLYQAWQEEQPIISGGAKLDLKWALHRDGIQKARVPADFRSDQLFVNGERQPMARYPNFDASVRIYNGYARDAISPERARRWTDPRGGFIHAMHQAMWGGMHYVITGKDAQGNLTYEGGWQNNRPAPMHREYRFVENVFEELDAPGEWFLSRSVVAPDRNGAVASGSSSAPEKSGTGGTSVLRPDPATLYFFPPPGLDLAKATIEAVRLRHLIEFRGTAERPVKFLQLRGLTFRHAARTFMDNKEPLLRSDWTTYRGGAVFFNGTEDCTLEDCFLDQVGGNAVFVNNYNRRVVVRGCRIANAGANGVAFVGDPRAARNGITWKQQNEFTQIDRTPGPQSPNHPAACLVEDCLIYRSGRVEKQTAPVQIAMAQDITVRHCSIYDVPRAGLNIGDGCWGGHVIEFCDIFDTVKETGDHGSFNSWGRDRFWGLKGVDLNTVTLGDNKNLPLLDAVKPVILRNNRWRCDHGWDIDLDDGSSNYELRNNLCLNGGLKNREGFYRVVENNVVVNNSFHPHVWYGNSQDVFRRNILFTGYRPISVKKPWGRECDFNLLHKPGQTQPASATGFQQQSGLDAHSIEADALFVDAAKGDYRVKAGSPALALGFQNFPMDNFGVRKPALKALARTPELPDPNQRRAEPKPRRDSRVVEWLGAKIKNVTGLGEVSASGLPGEIGVRVVEAPGTSLAAQAGLRENDVILKCGGKDVNTLAEFLRAYRAAPAGGKARVEVFRGQQRATLEVTASEEIVLSAAEANILGPGKLPVYDGAKDFLGSWTNPGAWLEWRFALAKPGEYEVRLTLSSVSSGNEFTLKIGDQALPGVVPQTGDWETFATVKLGVVRLAQAGEVTVSLKPGKASGAVMNLRSVVLQPSR